MNQISTTTSTVELANGLSLAKTVFEFDDEEIDQVNVYRITSILKDDVEVLVDISGSDCVFFEGLTPASLTKKTKVRAFETVEVAKLVLVEEWNLKIKFDYQTLTRNPAFDPHSIEKTASLVAKKTSSFEEAAFERCSSLFKLVDFNSIDLKEMTSLLSSA